MTAHEKRLYHWVAQIGREIRREHGVKDRDFADYLNITEESVRRFEGSLLERGPADLDAIVAVLAAIEGHGDGRLIYRRALDRWEQEKSGQPELPAPRPTRPLAGEAYQPLDNLLDRRERAAGRKRTRHQRRRK